MEQALRQMNDNLIEGEQALRQMNDNLIEGEPCTRLSCT